MGLLQSLGLTPRALISKGIGQLFGSIGMPNPMSLLSGGGGGGGGMSVPSPQQMPGQTVNVQNPEPQFQPIPMGTGQQRMQFEQQRSPQPLPPVANVTDQSANAPQQMLQYLFPTNSQKITSGFGNRTAPMPGASTFHQGVDIGAGAGSPLNAFTSGKILSVGQNSGLGNFMKMLGDDNRTYTYGHAQNFNVKPGQQVNAGQPVGAVGNTGISTAPHLHFMASEQGKYIDPSILFKQYLGN